MKKSQHQELLDSFALVSAEVTGLRAEVAELRTEVAALRTDLTALSASTDRRFESVDRRFDRMERRFDRMDHRFDQTDRKIDAVNADLGTRIDRGRDEVLDLLGRVYHEVKGRLEDVEGGRSGHRLS